MRWPKIRLSLWVLMSLVGLAGGVFGVMRLRQRSERFLQRADDYRRVEEIGREQEHQSVQIAESYKQPIAFGLVPKGKRDEHMRSAERSHKFVEHAIMMRRRYERAAARPWESVPPEPVPPPLN